MYYNASKRRVNIFSMSIFFAQTDLLPRDCRWSSRNGGSDDATFTLFAPTQAGSRLDSYPFRYGSCHWLHKCNICRSYSFDTCNIMLARLQRNEFSNRYMYVLFRCIAIKLNEKADLFYSFHWEVLAWCHSSLHRMLRVIIDQTNALLSGYFV